MQAKSYNTVSNLSQVQVQGQMALDIFKQIETMTQGRVKLVWHDAGDLIPVSMHINAVSSGSVPTAFTAFAYFGGTLPIANIYSGYPFSPGVDEWIQWLYQGDGLKILQETLDPLNIVAIPIMATPREAGGFFKREIKTPEDFKGLRFRIGGWGSEVVSRLGAAHQSGSGHGTVSGHGSPVVSTPWNSPAPRLMNPGDSTSWLLTTTSPAGISLWAGSGCSSTKRHGTS